MYSDVAINAEGKPRVQKVAWVKLTFIAFLVLGQAIPSNLITLLVPAVFRDIGVPLEQFYMISLAGLPIWFKWAWAPMVDRTGWKAFGLRKSWILPSTIVSVGIYVAIGMVQPAIGVVGFLVFLLTLKTLATGFQDVAVDGFTVENITAKERPYSATMNQVFLFIGLIVVNAIMLPLYESHGWMAICVAAGLLFLVFTLPAMTIGEQPPTSAKLAKWSAPGSETILGFTLRSLKGFATRIDSYPIILIFLLFGTFEGYIVGLTTAFLRDEGMDYASIGIAFAIAFTAGALFGGGIAAWLIDKLGLRKTALLLAPIAALPAGALLVLSLHDGGVTLLSASIALSVTLGASMPLTVLASTMRLEWASQSQAGTDFSIHSSVSRGSVLIGIALGGLIAGKFGYVTYYALGIPFGVVSLLIAFAFTGWIEREVKQRELRLNGPQI